MSCRAPALVAVDSEDAKRQAVDSVPTAMIAVQRSATTDAPVTARAA
jgi:hypothetical protein